MRLSGSAPPVVYVTIYSTPKPLWKRGRHQAWRWKAISEGNSRTLASGEAFTNRQDCIDSVRLLFGDRSTVFLRQSEQGNQLLRLMTATAKYHAPDCDGSGCGGCGWLDEHGRWWPGPCPPEHQPHQQERAEGW